MDRIIRITLTLFILILAATAAITGYNGYVDAAYRDSINGTYTYTYTMTIDGPITNLTLFIPVPDDRTGNSPIVSYFGNGGMSGMPADWNTTLFGTGKATLLKITAPSVTQPEGTTPASPFTISFSMDFSQKSPVATRDPVDRGVIFRPVQNLQEKTCPAGSPAGSRCSVYTTALYADYHAEKNTMMTFTSSVDGKNTWRIFEPRSNEYHTEIRLSLKGPQRGWSAASGTLLSGFGSYEYPFGS